jgi:hypothetical protein
MLCALKYLYYTSIDSFKRQVNFENKLFKDSITFLEKIRKETFILKKKEVVFEEVDPRGMFENILQSLAQSLGWVRIVTWSQLNLL